MRLKKILLFFVALTFTSILYAQSEDVLYLKNGSIIRGSVVEVDPTNGVKIQTTDGSLFVFSMAEVDHISKDQNINRGISSNGTIRKIDRHMSNFYWEDTKKGLTSEEYSSILDDNLYDTFYSARKQFKTGKALIYTGAVFTTVATLCYASYLSSEYYVYNFSTSYDESKLGLFYLTAGAADACFLIGFIFKGIGKGRLEWVKDTYNSERSYSSTINFSPSLMMTTQKDLGLGASVVFNF